MNEKYDVKQDYTSKVPQYTFAETLKEQEAQLLVEPPDAAA